MARSDPAFCVELNRLYTNNALLNLYLHPPAVYHSWLCVFVPAITGCIAFSVRRNEAERLSPVGPGISR